MTTLATFSDAPEIDLGTLTADLTGRVLTPDMAGYEALATPFNLAAISPLVAVIDVADAQDVVTVVRWAARHGVDVGVQCTGHGATRFNRPTLLIHTGSLDELTISRSSARVGAGVRWDEVIRAAAAHGLGALVGSAPGVGVVGYLTGGGLGPVARTFGFASDQVTAFDVVTGDGELRRATATENPDLFWGLRGGKGALGIVTAVEFHLLPLTEIFAGCWYFDGKDASVVTNAWRSWCETLPEQATTSLAILRLPNMPLVPPPLAGRVTVAVRFAWVGDPEDGQRVVEPMQRVADVVLGGVGVMPYAAVGAIHADPVEPKPIHDEAVLLRELTEATVEALLASAGPDASCPQLVVELRQLGGAIARVPQHPSAICHRGAAFTLMTIGLAVPPLIQATVAHARQLMSSMGPWSDGAGQPNFSSSPDPVKVAGNYDRPTLTRLGALARAYDPHGVLAAAHSIRAATT